MSDLRELLDAAAGEPVGATLVQFAEGLSVSADAIAGVG
jgi:hypothetical protein